MRLATPTMTLTVTMRSTTPIPIPCCQPLQAENPTPVAPTFCTGKSSTVMKARRKSIRASMKPRAARKTRLTILAEYQELQAALSTHQSPSPGPTPHGGEGSYDCLDIDMDASVDVDMTNDTDTDDANMVSCMRGSIFYTNQASRQEQVSKPTGR